MIQEKKYKVVFPFVEAGLGHIMPMKAVCDAFEKKYHEQAEIIRTYFFQNQNNEDLKLVESEFIQEVKRHNENKGRGALQFTLLRLLGQKRSLRYLFKKRFKKGYEPALEYLKELNADLIFNTHFSTLYYACEAREKGLIHSKISAYCPDPIIGLQWDRRVDMIGISSSIGKVKAQNSRLFKHSVIHHIPFLLRNEVKEYDKGRTYYRNELAIPENQFTILLADGAYGAGKLRDTVYELMNSKLNLTIIAVCGKNHELYVELQTLNVPPHITFVPYGFTDKMLLLSASCDLFIGKAGASNLAEVTYFEVPSIITFCATSIEKWISNHYTNYLGCAIYETNIKKVRHLVEQFIINPEMLAQYKNACHSEHRTDGPEKMADYIWEQLIIN